MDETEAIRREEVARINSEVVSDDKDAERARLEAIYGEVYDTDQIRQIFEVLGFAAPFMIVKWKSDGRKGSLEFQHNPRFYFNFVAY